VSDTNFPTLSARDFFPLTEVLRNASFLSNEACDREDDAPVADPML
jgi:hypothetical protein